MNDGSNHDMHQGTGQEDSRPRSSAKNVRVGEQVSKYGIWLGEDRGVYDTRNQLNDLMGKEWLQLTKSVWYSERCGEDKVAFEHPAPFLIRDIEKLVSLFTKRGELVLDPFVGSGTTLVACARLHREGIGVELNRDFVEDLVIPRLQPYTGERAEIQIDFFDKLGDNSIVEIPPEPAEIPPDIVNERKQFWQNVSRQEQHHLLTGIDGCKQAVMIGDARDLLDTIPPIDYCVTSPPYHNILKHEGGGVRHDNSQTRQGVEFYSDDPSDLGNLDSYREYLEALTFIMAKVYEKLRVGKYCSVIISDFTVDRRETNVHGDVISIMKDTLGLTFMGTTILAQDSKPLYPFGYPYQYRINHVHQYILSFLKTAD